MVFDDQVDGLSVPPVDSPGQLMDVVAHVGHNVPPQGDGVLAKERHHVLIRPLPFLVEGLLDEFQDVLVGHSGPMFPLRTAPRGFALPRQENAVNPVAPVFLVQGLPVEPELVLAFP